MDVILFILLRRIPPTIEKDQSGSIHPPSIAMALVIIDVIALWRILLETRELFRQRNVMKQGDFVSMERSSHV